jgi:FimV-like protein
MKHTMIVGGVLLALLLPPAEAAVSTHVVKRGETLSTIARKYRYPEVTQNQMILAIAHANMHAFRARSVDRLYIGTKLAIPERTAVAAIDAASADRDIARLGKAEQHYREAVRLERAKEHQAAFDAYLKAGNLGHALAELRLGELYDRGSPAVAHDLAESARWYQRARDHGLPVPAAESRAPQMR